MNPQNPSYQPSADLPKPQLPTDNGTDPVSGDPAKAPVDAGQSVTAVPDDAAQASTPGSSQAVPQSPPSTPPPLPADNTTKSQPEPTETLNTPPIAEDSDLIEQEWVDKAKAIVESNRSDPHKLNEQLSKFKAEYIKKRYNREIKIDVDNQ